MDAVYHHPAGHKHHFRKPEVKGGKATLKDDSGKVIFTDVPVSDKPEPGKCVITGAEKSSEK